MTDRLRANDYDITTLRPLWARRVYQLMEASIVDNKCDIVVYGNDRGFGSDVLIRDTGIALNVPTVVELLNLFPDAEMLPEYIIAPSHYAATHSSVTEAIDGMRKRQEGSVSVTQRTEALPEIFVVSPAVDLHKFNRSEAALHSIRYHPSCSLINQHYRPSVPLINGTLQRCFTVGFMARLAPEKNPGLFLQAAATLLREYHPHVRFTVIGTAHLYRCTVIF